MDPLARKAQQQINKQINGVVEGTDLTHNW